MDFSQNNMRVLFEITEEKSVVFRCETDEYLQLQVFLCNDVIYKNKWIGNFETKLLNIEQNNMVPCVKER